MIPIDFRTVFLTYTLINAVTLLIIVLLYFQLRKRFPETGLILLSFFMSATGNIFIFLRNSIPDFISISIANLLVVSSTVILLIALEKFTRTKGIQIHNYILLFIFFCVHTYFAFLKPDLNVRNLNFSVAYMLLSFQVAYLMLIRVPENMRKLTRRIGFIFVSIFFIQTIRIIYSLNSGNAAISYFNSALSESIFVLIWEIVLILLAYSIVLMYNKRLIIEVSAQEEKFFKAFHAAPFIIMLSKLSDGEIFEVNKSIESISGYQPEELLGLKSTDLNLWKNKNDRINFIKELESKGIVKENEYEFNKKSGVIFTGLISAELININNEKCIISIISDITNRKNAEVKLKTSESSLKELNSTKDKFFSIIAHDLKSPFNGILGFSELLVEQVRDKNYEGMESYAEIINKSSQSAVALLSNLMEWSRAQTGRMEFNPEYIDIVVMIQTVTDLLRISAEQKSIKLTMHLPQILILFADNAMMETILRNLISNAIKFTPHNGAIIISAEEKENECVVFVKDNGVGIDKGNIEKIFRIDNSLSTPGTENERGTGLGLILCKDFIEKHKGKIWVESEIDKGSTFYFGLPKK